MVGNERVIIQNRTSRGQRYVPILTRTHTTYRKFIRTDTLCALIRRVVRVDTPFIRFSDKNENKFVVIGFFVRFLQI